MGDRCRDLYQKYRDFTMIPEQVYVRNLRIAERVQEVDGCVVECGVWRGGMIAGIAELLGAHRKYFLFDSFAGLPPAQEIDGVTARKWQADMSSPLYHDNCSAPIEVAQQAMQMSGVSDYTIVPGWFQETLPNFNPPAPIALLRLDGDWYESTMEALSRLYDFVPDQGLIIIDDYYTWDGCGRAVHEFLAQAAALRCVLQFDNEVCVLAPCRFSFYDNGRENIAEAPRGDRALDQDQTIQALRSELTQQARELRSKDQEVEFLHAEVAKLRDHVERTRAAMSAPRSRQLANSSTIQKLFRCWRLVPGLFPVSTRRKWEERIILDSGLFDRTEYHRHYPALAGSDLNLIRHYLELGAASGANPNPLFDSRYYLESNPDVSSAGMNPLVHYIVFGAAEGRNPHPVFNTLENTRRTRD